MIKFAAAIAIAILAGNVLANSIDIEPRTGINNNETAQLIDLNR